MCILLPCITTGCVAVISKELREDISKELTFKEIIKKPDAHKRKIVLISGVISGSRNTEEGALIKILQKPVDMEGRARDYIFS